MAEITVLNRWGKYPHEYMMKQDTDYGFAILDKYHGEVDAGPVCCSLLVDSLLLKSVVFTNNSVTKTVTMK